MSVIKMLSHVVCVINKILSRVSLSGSEPRVQWSQQSRDQRCLPARQQPPDLHWWERHQHPAVGGCLGNCHLPHILPSQSGTCNLSDPSHSITVLPCCHQGAPSPLCLLEIERKRKHMHTVKSLVTDVTADERFIRVINYILFSVLLFVIECRSNLLRCRT